MSKEELITFRDYLKKYIYYLCEIDSLYVLDQVSEVLRSVNDDIK